MKRMRMFLFALSLLMSMPFLVQARDGPGAVYVMANTDADHGNEIIIFDRAADGMLTLAGTAATGGSGFMVEPGDELGSQGPLILSPDHRWLFAVNAGSEEISVFEVNQCGLTLMQVISSGGDFPVSLTLHKNLLYVLNAGGDGNITGFLLGPNGNLKLLDGSTRSLNTGGTSPPDVLVSPAQVGFNPHGDQLVVTLKGGEFGEPKPQVKVFAVGRDGMPSTRPVSTNFERGPFGFVFDGLMNLIVAEQFGANGLGAVSSYLVTADGSLNEGSTVGNGQLATCWIAITSRKSYAYGTDNPGGMIGSFMVAPGGSLELINPAAAETGNAPVDLAITPNNQYLYNVNAGDGTVGMFKIDPTNGDLISLGEIGGLPMDGSAVGIAVR